MLIIAFTQVFGQQNLPFLCSVISQGKVVALDRWGGKWNHLLMTPRLTTDYAKIIVIGHLLLKLL